VEDRYQTTLCVSYLFQRQFQGSFTVCRAVTAKVKNISKTIMGDKAGRIHMEHQNLDKMNSRRATALRGERHTKRDLENSPGEVQSKPKRSRSA
jgi:hypothetical protein